MLPSSVSSALNRVRRPARQPERVIESDHGRLDGEGSDVAQSLGGASQLEALAVGQEDVVGGRQPDDVGAVMLSASSRLPAMVMLFWEPTVTWLST